MRLNLQSPALAGIRSTLESSFESALPGEDVLARAWADPAIRQLFRPETAPEIGRLMQQTAMTAFSHVQGLTGINVGVPGQVLSNFAQSITAEAIENGTVDWANFVTSGVQAVTDIALDAMGAVPIVGWIAKAAMAIINAIINAATRDEPLPLLPTYNKSADEFEAQRAINLLGTLHKATLNDWSPLFMPPGSGPWKYREAENGYIAGPEYAAEGLGALFPGVFGSRQILITSWPSIIRAIGEAHKQNPLGYQPVRNTIMRSSADIYEQYPSLERVVLAAWSAISTNNTSAVFNVVPNIIGGAWNDYVENGLEFSNRFGGFNKVGLTPSDAVAAAVRVRLTSPTLQYKLPPGVRASFLGGGTATRVPLNEIASVWATFIDKRQKELVRSRMVAYCSEQQSAFQRNTTLREMLIDNRKLFIKTKDADDVALSDIVDADFREAVQSYQGARQGRMPGKPPVTPGNAPPVLVGYAAGGGGGGGAALAAGVALAVAAAVMLRRGR